MPKTQKRMLLIFNPHAGQRHFAANLFEVVDKFTRSGYEVTTFPTQAAGDAAEMILRRASEFDCLVVSGGDGTLHETVNALMACEKKPRLGYIPSGTTNDFATSLNLPKDVLEAASVVTDGEPCILDVGQFGKQYFSYVAAFGLFTDVSYGTPQSKKNVLGHLAYLLEGVKRLGSVHTHHCTLQLDGETLEGDYMLGLITNSLSVGGFKLPADRDIHMDDGLFEILLLQRPTSFTDMQSVIAKLINQDRDSDLIIVRHAASLTVSSSTPIAWTLDGEFGGEFAEIAVTNCHHALEIMMPRKIPEDLST